MPSFRWGKASTRLSELVSCHSSLSPQVWLLRRQAGPQAAKASSSGNPSQNLDPSRSQKQAQGGAALHALIENSTAGWRPCWAPNEQGKKKKKCDFYPSFGSDSLPENPASAGSHRPRLQRHQLIPSQTLDDQSAGRRAQDTEPGNVQFGQKKKK